MKKELYQKIAIPEGVEAKVDGSRVNIRGKEGELTKNFKKDKLEIKVDGKIIVLGNKKSTKKEKRLMNTLRAHIKNMILGVQEKFEYKLKIASGHFPMTIEVKGNEALVKNFLGEKIARKVRIPAGVEVEVGKEFITIKSIDKELAGQTAGNFEKSTRISARDRRIFQDGIFIINKAGKEI